MNIGKRIKEARIEKGYTQEELGKLVGVQKSAIAKYENGRVVNIKRSTLQKLAKVLEIRPSEFIMDGSPVESASLHAKILTDHEVLEMINEYYKLDSKSRKLARELIHGLIDKSNH